MYSVFPHLAARPCCRLPLPFLGRVVCDSLTVILHGCNIVVILSVMTGLCATYGHLPLFMYGANYTEHIMCIPRCISCLLLVALCMHVSLGAQSMRVLWW